MVEFKRKYFMPVNTTISLFPVHYCSFISAMKTSLCLKTGYKFRQIMFKVFLRY